MAKETKNVITREWIEKELRFYNTADIRSCTLLFVVFSLIFIPIGLLAVNGVASEFKPVLIKIVLWVVLTPLVSAPSWISLLSLYKCFKERALIQKGDFEIVVKELSHKSEKLVYRNRRTRMEEVLHFADFKPISVGHTRYQLSSRGDEFYIVHYKGSNRIKFFYPLKMYEYIEK